MAWLAIVLALAAFALATAALLNQTRAIHGQPAGSDAEPEKPSATDERDNSQQTVPVAESEPQSENRDAKSKGGAVERRDNPPRFWTVETISTMINAVSALLIAAFTAIIMLTGIAAWRTSGRQAQIMEGTLSQMASDSAGQAAQFAQQLTAVEMNAKAAVAASEAAAKQAEIMDSALAAQKSQLTIVGQQLETSVRQADISEKDFKLSQRPWIVIREARCVGLWIKDGRLYLNIAVAFQNIGKTPAQNVRWRIEIPRFDKYGPGTLAAPEPIQIARDMAAADAVTFAHAQKFTRQVIFPNEILAMNTLITHDSVGFGGKTVAAMYSGVLWIAYESPDVGGGGLTAKSLSISAHRTFPEEAPKDLVFAPDEITTMQSQSVAE